MKSPLRRVFASVGVLALFALAPAPAFARPDIALTAPAVELDLSVTTLYEGETTTVRWNAENAAWCRAGGAWTGNKPARGEQQVGPLETPGSIMLECGNPAGTSSARRAFRIDGDRPLNGGGVFDIGCNYSHSLPDDPIVFPRAPGASHMHDFFGFTGTNADSTHEQMRRVLAERPTATTCTEETRRLGGPPAANASAYWVPAMYLNGSKIDALNIHVYYRNEGRRTVASFPPGFRMIAGDAHANPERAKADGVIRWWCGGLNFPEVDRLPRDCDGRQGIHAEIRFAACWDGRIDSPDHKAHVAFKGENGKCPQTHRLKLPRVLLHVTYDVYGALRRTLRSADKVTIASGGMWTMHADYLFAWDPFRLDFLVHTCLNAKIMCKADPPRLDGAEAPAAPELSSPPSVPDEPRPKEADLRLQVLDTKPAAPRAGEKFTITFAVLSRDDRIEPGVLSCEGRVGDEVVRLVRASVERRTGSCVWAIPERAHGRFSATLGVHAQGRHIRDIFDAQVR